LKFILGIRLFETSIRAHALDARLSVTEPGTSAEEKRSRPSSGLLKTSVEEFGIWAFENEQIQSDR